MNTCLISSIKEASVPVQISFKSSRGERPLPVAPRIIKLTGWSSSVLVAVELYNLCPTMWVVSNQIPAGVEPSYWERRYMAVLLGLKMPYSETRILAIFSPSLQYLWTFQVSQNFITSR
jgi:hypothetical protein